MNLTVSDLITSIVNNQHTEESRKLLDEVIRLKNPACKYPYYDFFDRYFDSLSYAAGVNFNITMKLLRVRNMDVKKHYLNRILTKYSFDFSVWQLLKVIKELGLSNIRRDMEYSPVLLSLLNDRPLRAVLFLMLGYPMPEAYRSIEYTLVSKDFDDKQIQTCKINAEQKYDGMHFVWVLLAKILSW